MPRLPPAVVRAIRNFQIRMDIEDLQNAYLSALKGLLHREGEIEAMVRAELNLGPDDDWPDRDEGDLEDPVSLLYEHAGELDAQAKRGAPMVRTAFLIALFHAWERHCNARMNVEKYVTAYVNGVLMREGHESLCETIEYLQLAANCAKHGAGNSGRSLFQKRPEFFPRARTAADASEKTLHITEEALAGFFRVILSAAR
jgi:hypothetical protein